MSLEPVVIVLEGSDGAGKSTLIPPLAEWLAERRRRPVHCFRDPGSTPLGEKIRLLVKNANEPMEQTTQFLLFCAARAELAARVNRCFKAGEDVILDRWWFSTYAYQGALGINKMLIQGIALETAVLYAEPIVFLLDVSEEVARSRIAADAVSRQSTLIKDRFESMGPEFRQRMREGYVDISTMTVMSRINTDELTSAEVFAKVTAKLETGWGIR